MKRIRWLTMVLLVGVLALLGACGNQTASNETRDYFKVGVITSLSGSEVYGGNVTKRGYEIWAETVNEQGGIEIDGKKYKVELVFADDQSDPTSGADAAERMITSEKVDFILGPYTSGVTLAVAPILEKYKVPMITGSAESPLIWKEQFKYTFGTIPAVDLTSGSPIRTLAKEVNPAPKTIAIIGVNDPFSKAVAENFKAMAEEVGMEVVKFDIVPSGTDFTPLISAIKGLNPDVLAVGGHEKEHMEIIKASKSLGFMPQAFVMHYGITTPDFVNNLGKDAEYVFGAAIWTPDLNFEDPLFGSTADYVKKFTEKYGSTPDYTEAGCTATGIVFAEALQSSGLKPPLSDADREKLVEALENIQVNTLFGPISYATDGAWYHNNTGLQPLTIQLQDGKYNIVGPAEVKLTDPVYPVPPMDGR